IAHGRETTVDIKSIMAYTIAVNGRELHLDLVSIGNQHAVCFYQDPVCDFPLSQLGPKVEKHDVFPAGVNFEVARVVNRKQIEARVWEKGVGETLACGSGACAITVAAQLRGYIDNQVDIKLPGGILQVEWDGIGEVLLSGPAETVFTGEWPD
ncbi:diaminopimelate epimerase, partial [Chloroflexota bacterium]